jgi:hypothetical protein
VISTRPLRLAPIAVAVAVLSLALLACGSPADPGGPTATLPTVVPVGIDPREGDGSCLVSARSFDDDVTVPAGAACTFADVDVDGNLVLAPGATVTATGGFVGGNVLVYPGATYDAEGSEIDGSSSGTRAARAP